MAVATQRLAICRNRIGTGCLLVGLVLCLHRLATADPPDNPLFLIGHPDNHAAEIGENVISIRLEEKSWIIYDYVALHAENRPLEITTPPKPDLLAEFRDGPAAGVDEIIFAARAPTGNDRWCSTATCTRARP